MDIYNTSKWDSWGAEQCSTANNNLSESQQPSQQSIFSNYDYEEHRWQAQQLPASVQPPSAFSLVQSLPETTPQSSAPPLPSASQPLPSAQQEAIPQPPMPTSQQWFNAMLQGQQHVAASFPASPYFYQSTYSFPSMPREQSQFPFYPWMHLSRTAKCKDRGQQQKDADELGISKTISYI